MPVFEFKYTTSKNMDQSDQFFSNWITEMRDPEPVRLLNSVPYIPMLEYGGIRTYARKKPQKKIGVFRFAKGGVVTRSPMQTQVFQPPHAMVRRTKISLRIYGRSIFQQRVPVNHKDSREMLITSGKYALKRVKEYTHVLDDIARQGWRLET